MFKLCLFSLSLLSTLVILTHGLSSLIVCCGVNLRRASLFHRIKENLEMSRNSISRHFGKKIISQFTLF